MPELVGKNLTEEFWSDLKIFEDVDEITKKPRMRVIGTVQEANLKNHNTRWYDKEILEEGLKNLSEKVLRGRAFGEIDHPEVRGRLRETAHIIKDIRWLKDNPNQVEAEVLILNTPSGEILKEILRAGGRPGFSSRGFGTTSKVNIEGVGEVEKVDKGYRWESIDFVIDPSVHGAEITQIIEHAEQGVKDPITEEHVDMTTALLKEKHPEIVVEIRAEVEKEISEKLKADFDVKLAEAQAKITKLEEQMNGQNQEEDRNLTTIQAIVDVLDAGGYLGGGGEEEVPPDQYMGGGGGALPMGRRSYDATREWKNEDGTPMSEEQKKVAIAKLEEERKIVEDKITALEAKNKELADALKAKDEEVAKIAEAKQLADVANYILEKTAPLDFGKLVAERLKTRNPKTREEVDKTLEEDVAFAKALLSEEGTAIVGKGRSSKPEGTPVESTEEQLFQEKMQALGGMKSKTKESK